MTQTEPTHDDLPQDNPAEGAAPEAATPAAPAADEQKAALEAEVARLKDHLLRTLAEMDNTRKRAQKDREDAGKYAIAAFARDLLDFAGNFHRALESIPADLKSADARVGNVISGIEAMEKVLLSTFERHGIKKIEPLGVPFDPHFHEVMFEAPGTGKPAGIVVQVVEPGYIISDRLLRPAKVGVAKGEAGAAPSRPGDQIDTSA